ncbi:unnamed protein product [Blepharisma stoltei]|uniref:Uncharacterized protein n=1 Tax=Blepharisma stoltei TaxID=1481888 RepID=A0AAU9J3Z9_9CILI|nr:unnamed protein product [Blepharisma stoltei]
MDNRVSERVENIVNLDDRSMLDEENKFYYDLEPMDISEPYTSSITDSTDHYSSNIEYHSENHDLLEDIFVSDQKERRKRGRRPIRPQDPIRKKTEEKDKYWLRAFRSYTYQNYNDIIKGLSKSDADFWQFYMSPDGKPGKGHKFLSYGKIYKTFLFSHTTFRSAFKNWFEQYGDELLKKKYEPGSDKWFVFYDYASKDLCYYDMPQPIPESPPSPLVCMTLDDVVPPEEFLLEFSEHTDTAL